MGKFFRLNRLRMVSILLSVLFIAACGGGGGGDTGDINENSAPIANAGADQNILNGSTVTLSGGGSDADGDLLAYNWAFTSKPSGSTAILTGSTAANPTFVADVDGVYILTLTVDDGKEISMVDSVTITAATLNSAPTANAGPDQNVATGNLVTLNGGGSDADGDLLTYSWAITTAPNGSTATLTGSTTSNSSFTPDVAGNYIVILTVSDGILTANSTVAVSTDTLNSLAVAPLERTISLGQTKQYMATGVFTSAGSSDVSNAVVWTSSNTAVATINPAGLATSKGQGTTTITATMADISSATTLTVGPVTLVSVAIEGETFPSLLDGQTLQLTATAVNSDGTTSNVTELASWSTPMSSLRATYVNVSNSPGTKGFVTTTGKIGNESVQVVYGKFSDSVIVLVK